VGANLEPADFAENHAPAILFAFTREWLHRLTSNAGGWPPILLPPVNVLELRRKKHAVPK
jgi:preprotein translocase subunit SecB